MVEIRRILCPIDFSDTSQHALEHAVAIAKWYESKITALHVINPALLIEPPILVGEFRGGGAPAETDRESLRNQLESWLRPAEAVGVKTDLVFDEGNPTGSIVDWSASLPADLVVIGTHGRGGFERFLLGSVTEKVLRKVTCPTLTVPPPAVTPVMLPYKRLLSPVDFSETSLAALRFAMSIAQESDAHLTVLHVVDWADELLTERFDTKAFHGVVEHEAQTRLDGLVTDEMRNWCEPETKIESGKPYRRILETADRDHADLIVMGVRGRNALDLMLFGSTANHVVRRATCPVLTLRQ
jgi:nucleotide-binding universal stress UspA family protein